MLSFIVSLSSFSLDVLATLVVGTFPSVPKALLSNSSCLASLSMFSPAQGITAAKEFVLDCVRKAGPNACPPLVVGVGIGGNAECAPLLAKKALLRSLDERNPDPETAKLEEELLERINALGIGPMGLGGKTTALAVAIETSPCHIASFPVAVNLNCHVHRHASRIL